MTSYSSHQFQKEYKLVVDKEFEFNGKKAEWAAQDKGPRFWGEEDESIKLKKSDPPMGNVTSRAAALTPDGRFLAVSTNAVVRIYDVDSLATTAELIGHESNVQKLYFVDQQPTSSHDQSARYTLLSDAAKVGGTDGQIFAWAIDAEGQHLRSQSRMPFAIPTLSDRAVGAISQDLVVHHELSIDAVDAVRDGFASALWYADAENRARAVPKAAGHFPSFGSRVPSHDRSRVLHIDHGTTTQHGLRPPAELPQIVVRELPGLGERCRLKGHEDAIMWAAWSPDDRTIATACWDKTFRIWDAESGECRHTIGGTGGQNWSGGFFPDGKHVVLSGGQPVRFAVYEVETAREVVRLSAPEEDGGKVIKLDGWLRYFKISPVADEDLVVLQNRIGLLGWKAPLGRGELALREFGSESESSADSSSSSSDVEEIFAFERVEQRKIFFLSIYPVAWVDGGAKLLAQSSENTTFVWDRKRNLKWRFQRPMGLVLESGCTCFFVKRKGAEWVISLDGDGIVRFWKL